MTLNHSDELSRVLGIIAKTLALSVLQSDELKKKPIKEKIVLLNRIGFNPDEISMLLATSIGNVRKELSLARRASEKPAELEAS